KRQEHLKIKGEIPAGSNEPVTLEENVAARIFTGAPVPSGADTVVMQEKVSVKDGYLAINDENLQLGNNVRVRGAEIKAGSLALEKDCYLSAAAIGFLAGTGVSKVAVYSKPLVSIIVTGKELQQPGKPLHYGQVYESNSFSLAAALKQLHFTDMRITEVDDDPGKLKSVLKDALLQSDMVLLTGGISVGDYDYVLQATTACTVTNLFHKVKQKPGKPLFFGMKEKKPVFGLPGNPASVLTCFYEYVVPALEKLCNRKNLSKIIKAPLAKSFQKKAGLTHFLKGWYANNRVTLLDAQESYRLSSFAKANCLVRIDEAITSCEEGEMVAINILPI
ncbi:MAG TPA: molybdopterin molybdotransferase MoeA, partial [Agriterribacter sp.]|nr:molybdopterin molybdotransferase MoeA [Agriterribacter sp.]